LVATCASRRTNIGFGVSTESGVYPASTARVRTALDQVGVPRETTDDGAPKMRWEAAVR
jgi:hypothetical protein